MNNLQRINDELYIDMNTVERILIKGKICAHKKDNTKNKTKYYASFIIKDNNQDLSKILIQPPKSKLFNTRHELYDFIDSLLKTKE